MIRTIAPFLSIVLMAGAYGGYRYQRASLATTSSDARSEMIAYQASNDRERWAYDLATRLGNPQPSADIVALIVAWTNAEDRSAGAFERNNPLNTTENSAAMMVINSDSVKGYASYEDGMFATVQTLSYNHPGYAEIVAGIQTNDVDRALAGIHTSPWGTDIQTVESIYRTEKPAAHQFADTNNMIASNPIALTNDDCGWNVSAALNANGAALQHVRLAPGETFSFNATMGDPVVIEYRNCMGVPGGNWCNLAARYAQVARAIGLTPQFQDHGVGDLGAGAENSVAIWNEDGVAGNGQDLLIQNTTNRLATFRATQQGDSIVIVGSVD